MQWRAIALYTSGTGSRDRSIIIVKPLSAQLADLSVRAKKAEDAVAAAQKEAHDKLIARREQAQADATAAIQKMDQDIKAR